MKYWFHPEMTWKVFKKLNKPFQGEIVPELGDKMLWEMLRDRKINMYFSDSLKDKNDPIVITTHNISGGRIIRGERNKKGCAVDNSP